jgi:hypothetical protein
MPKGKSKLSAVLSRPKKLARADVVDATLIALTSRLDAADHAIDELNEAICPRVAARLTALERRTEAYATDLVRGARAAANVEQRVEQLENASHRDDADKRKVFEVLSALRTTVVERVTNLERVIQAIQRAPKADAEPVIVDGKGQATAPSKATDRGLVSYLITMIKREMGLEFTEQGMKRIIELIEKV